MELVQTSTSDVVRGQARYTTVSYVDSAQTAPLPDAGVFLFRIIDVDRPQLDRFERVCVPADVRAYSADRVEAVRNRESYVRASSLTRTNTSSQVAVAEATAVKDLVASLETQWRTFADEFEGERTWVFPLTDPTTKAALIADFTAARDLQEATQEELTDAQTDLQAAETLLAELEDRLAEVTQARAEILNVQAQIQSIYTQASLLRTQARTYIGVVQAGLDDYTDVHPTDPGDATWDHFGDDPPHEGTVVAATTTFTTQVGAFAGYVGQWTAVVTDMTQAASAVQAAVTALSTRVTTASTSVTTLTNTRERLRAQLSRQATNTFNARASLLAYCPDVDPEDL